MASCHNVMKTNLPNLSSWWLVRVEVRAEEVALGRAAGQHRHHVPRVQARARRRHLLFIPGRNIARWGETIVSLELEGREFDSGPIYMYIHIHL